MSARPPGPEGGARPTIHVFVNPRARRNTPYGPSQAEVVNSHAFAEARAEITSWPGYAPTPLLALDGLAARAGIARLWCKYEGDRFGLGSFKALGGAYAVLNLLAQEIKARTGREEITTGDLASGAYRELTERVTVTCATDGNHGRAVAWGAKTFGCRCVIYLHEHVSRGREAAIARLGAEIVRVPGDYDDSVRRCAADAERLGRYVISDTSYPGYMTVPRQVMQGYTVLAEEVLDQLGQGERPTHLFVQAGVGGLAAAVCGHLWERLGPARARFVIVEPEKADCLYQTAVNGRPTVVPGPHDTLMACLAAGEVSALAWRILESGADAFVTIPDEPAAEAMRMLAEGTGGDPPIVAGETGVAGLAALMTALEHDGARHALELGPSSRVLVILSEGATDPEIYQRIVGRAPEDVARRA
ncbi:MAG: diaminopropionate ammonia-lyase [Alphaproteobacteria bacterium]